MKKKPFKALYWAFLLVAIVVTCSGCFWAGDPGYYGPDYYGPAYIGPGYYGRGGIYVRGGGWHGGGHGGWHTYGGGGGGGREHYGR